MNNEYYTADTHFNSDRTLKFSRRPFKSVMDMNCQLINGINSLPPRSVLWVLGDWGEPAYISSVRQDIEVRLVMGNWDYFYFEESGLTMEEWCKKLLEMGFNAVYPEPIEEKLDGADPVWFCHKPSERNPNLFNLFGHIHRTRLIVKNGLNVGVDVHEYKPVDIDTVLFYKNSIENYYDDEHWQV